jgi:serine protease Do
MKAIWSHIIKGFAILVLSSFIASCATTQDSKQIPSLSIKKDSDELETRNYSAFSDQGDHLTELVNAGLYRQAARLYDKYSDTYFKKKGIFSKVTNKEKYSEQLTKTATHLNKYYTDKIDEAYSRIKSHTFWPSDQNNWSLIASGLEYSKDISAKYDSYSLLREEKYRLPKINELTLSKKNLEDNLQLYAKDSFREYDIFNGINFLKKYPISIVSESNFIDNNFEVILSKLQSATSTQIEIFFNTYKSALSDQKHKILSSSYVDTFLKEKSEGGETIDLRKLLNVIDTATDKGFILEDVKGLKVAFVEATSLTLLGEGQIEFPAKVNVDLPFEYKTLELGTALSEVEDSNYVVVFDVAVATVKRRIKNREKMDSKFLAGYKDVPNSKFKEVVVAMRESERGLASAQSMYCDPNAGFAGLICIIAKNSAVNKWRNHLNSANQAYITTPEYIQEEIYRKYQFSVSNIEVTKTMSVNYYILDRVNKKYFKSVFDVSENKSFRIAYNLKDEDLSLASHLSTYDSEGDVENFEEAPVAVKLSDLLEHYIANIDSVKELSSEDILRAEMLQDKNISIANYKKQTYDARPLNDARFDSVVVVYNPTGSLGTGFYVKPNLILTNYHVIEETKFVEMKLYNGSETFGKVIKSDVRLDLALIKVEARGKPVEFYDSNIIELGNEVEAIGHPSGLDFSITRGVVSAIRKRRSVYDTGGKEIVFIQTDAAINPGNSGGPLFLENKVIGVNNQKIVANAVEGLGFAIHFSEVQNFMKEEF